MIQKLAQFLSGAQGKKIVVPAVILLILFLIAAIFIFELRAPVSAVADFKVVEIRNGYGFRRIVSNLAGENLIRSRFAFEALAIFTGAARKLQPGVYRLNSAMTAPEILRELTSGSHREATVTIPEGSSMYDIEKVLSDSDVVVPGNFVQVAQKEDLEGKLFPDTYRFFTDSSAEEVLAKLAENFRVKAETLLVLKPEDKKINLILASLIQNEVPNTEDQKIVAGILKKRLVAGMPLQVDATICYIKEVRSYPHGQNCYPLTPLDFKIDSPYNTYLNRGWPAGPIGNPGLDAIKAAINPRSSPYWFYLSDPRTKKTIFARTFDEHNLNRAKYLR